MSTRGILFVAAGERMAHCADTYVRALRELDCFLPITVAADLPEHVCSKDVYVYPLEPFVGEIPLRRMDLYTTYDRTLYLNCVLEPAVNPEGVQELWQNTVCIGTDLVGYAANNPVFARWETMPAYSTLEAAATEEGVVLHSLHHLRNLLWSSTG